MSKLCEWLANEELAAQDDLQIKLKIIPVQVNGLEQLEMFPEMFQIIKARRGDEAQELPIANPLH